MVYFKTTRSGYRDMIRYSRPFQVIAFKDIEEGLRSIRRYGEMNEYFLVGCVTGTEDIFLDGDLEIPIIHLHQNMSIFPLYSKL